MLRAVNDYFLIERIPEQWAGGQDGEEGIRQGLIVGISDRQDVAFFGFNTYMFDKSLMDDELLDKIHAHYSKWVGKTVTWPERSESGTKFMHDGHEYYHLKWSAISSVIEEDK